MSPLRNILVVGATGKQGGAVIKSLLALPKSNPPLRILALTRNAEAASAKSLLAAHGDGLIEVVQGDLAKPKSVFDSSSSSLPKGSIDSMFLVTTPGHGRNATPEDVLAIPFIDAAVEHGVRHIVLSSVDRGGNEKSWTNATDIPHFVTKHRIEHHIRDKAAAATAPNKFTWTILRPVAFFENWATGFFGSMFSALMAASFRPETKLQLVSTHDIGVFAAAALAEPDKWAGRAVGLAGDALTLDEAKAKFHKVTGQTLPQTYTILAHLLKYLILDVNNMFTWFAEEGYGVDIEALRRELPTQDFETWLKESSPWAKK